MVKKIQRTGKAGINIILSLAILCVVLFAISFVTNAQSSGSEVITDANGLPLEAVSTRILSEVRQEVISQRGPNRRVWQIVREIETVDPATSEVTVEETISKIIEVGTGICYRDARNQWQATDASWSATDDGFAMAKAGYKLEIGSTLGSWLKYTVDGEVMQLRANKLVAFDGQQTDILAEANADIQGVIGARDASRLLFANAFGEGVDLELQVLPGGYHQNVIFRNKPRISAALNRVDTKIHLFTELNLLGYSEDVMVDLGFEDGICRTVAQLTDTEPAAGDISFVRATSRDGVSSQQILHRFVDSEVFDNAKRKTVANKSLVKDATGKRFLIEALEHSFLENASYPVVWDYSTKTESDDITSDTVWYAGWTYYVTEDVDVSQGELRIEPGTIVKFANGKTLSTSSTGKIIARGTPHKRIIFTSEDDNSTGNTISSSDGSPYLGDWSGIGIGDGSEFEFCRVMYSDGVNITGALGIPFQHNVVAYNWTSLKINGYIPNDTISIFNNLFLPDPCNVADPCDSTIFINTTGGTIDISNNTINGMGTGIFVSGYCMSVVNVFNNVIANCNIGILRTDPYYGTLDVDLNGYYNNDTIASGHTIDYENLIFEESSPFTSTMGFHLKTTATSKNAGTGPVGDFYDNPEEWSIFALSEVAPSRRFSSATTISKSTNWTTHTDTCDTGTVDFGYHHPRIDYVIYNANVTVDGGDDKVTLAIESGVVIAHSVSQTTGNGKLLITGGDEIICVGDPFEEGYVTWVEYNKFHFPSYSSAAFSNTKAFIELAADSEYDFRFTGFYNLGFAMVVNDESGTIRDNIFFLNTRAVDYRSTDDYVIENCLFIANNMGVRDCLGNNGVVKNCTFDHNNMGISFVVGSGESMLAQNNLFTENGYGIRLNSAGILNESYNGYYNNGSGTSDNVYEITSDTATINSSYQEVLTADPYETAWIDFDDRFRLDQSQTTSPCLINRGYDLGEEGMLMYTTSLNGREDKYVETPSEKLDIGYHYRGIPAYSNSFEGDSDNYSDWSPDFYMESPTFYEGPDEDGVYTSIEYQYVNTDYGTVSKSFDKHVGRNRFIRLNCIPASGEEILVKNGDDIIAAITFESSTPDDIIKVWDGGQSGYVDTGYDDDNNGSTAFDFDSAFTAFRTFTSTGYELYTNDPLPNGYSYEKIWVDVEIQLDWINQRYDIFWRYYDGTTDSEKTWIQIADDIPFEKKFNRFSKIEIVDTSGTLLKLNRVMVFTDDDWSAHDSGSDTLELTVMPPAASREEPLIGANPVEGNIWHHQLGKYVVKCCPTDANGLEPPDSDSWMRIERGDSIVQYGTQAIWDSFQFKNGDYYLKVEIYDDLGRFVNTSIAEKMIAYYDSNDNLYPVAPEDRWVWAEFPIIGLGKGKTYHYEEKPDVTVNWPGSFPFEFKRTYDDNLKGNLYPLFFGWTHNHNIRIIENCKMDWEEYDDAGTMRPAKDTIGLGIGKIWLSEAIGARMFMYDSSIASPITYKPVDNGPDYIERTSSKSSNDYTVSYTYYAPDGRIYTFNSTTITPGPSGGYTPRSTEGAVDWQIVKGIDTQADRFGNALTYTYNNDLTGRTAEAELFIMEIANNRTPAKLVFEDELQPFQYNEELTLYSKLKLTDGTYDADIMSFSFFYNTNAFYTYEKHVVNNQGTGFGSAVKADWAYSIDEEGVVLSYLNLPFEKLWHADDTLDTINLEYYPDGSLKKVLKDYSFEKYDIVGLNYIEEYSYESKAACLETITEYRVSCDEDYPYFIENEVLYLTLIETVNPYGAMIKRTATTHETTLSGAVFAPTVQDPVDMLGQIIGHGSRAGGGGKTDSEYLYGNVEFPNKPTTIMEYIDVDTDDDGVFDDQDTRKTTYAYDEKGNLAEQRRYIDDTDYVLTQYVYHDSYNFPIKQTVWKDYQTGATTPASPIGKRVEKQWLYGNYAGVLGNSGTGSDGDYPVEEKTLISENSDVWATTSYEYYDFDDTDGLDDGDGLLKIKTDPEGNENFYTYDDNGLPRKEWHGVTVISGVPQGNPQKRHYYNDFGLKELEADFLGKVIKLVYPINLDPPNPPQKSIWAEEARTYFDTLAMSLADTGTDAFVPATYGDPGTDPKYASSIHCNEYHYCEKPAIQTLPTGGKLHIGYFHDGETVLQTWYKENDGSMPTAPKVVCDFLGNPILALKDGVNGNYYVETQFVYDSMDRLLHKYEYNYQMITNAELESLPVGSPIIKHSEYGYYATGQKEYEKIYKVVRTEDAQGDPVFTPTTEKYTKYFYDALDRLIEQVEDPDDEAISTKFGYDAVGNRIYVIDPLGNYIITDHDNANRKTCEYFATAAEYVTGTTDLDFASMKTTAGKKTDIVYYDNNKFKSQTSYDYGGTILACKEFTYDSRGRILTVREYIEDTDDDGVMEANDDSSAVTTYAYSDGGGMTGEPSNDNYDYHIKITDAENKITWISLHPLAKPQKIVYPSGDVEHITYYGYGLPKEKSVFDTGGYIQTIQYEYDEFGKLSKVTYPDDAATSGIDESGTLEYEYTARTLGEYGKVATITDDRYTADNPGGADSTYEFEYYDWSGNLLSYTDPDGYQITYDYNTAWNRKSSIVVTDSSSDTVYNANYSYNLAGRLETVTDPDGIYDPTPEEWVSADIAGFVYDDNGNREHLDYYLEGVSTGDTYGMYYQYNENNFLTNITTTSGGVTSESDYSFEAATTGDIDGLGRLWLSEEIIHPDSLEMSNPDVTHKLSYTYDMRSQLLSAQMKDWDSSAWSPVRTYGYQYDDDGNINTETLDTVDTTFNFTGDLMTAKGGDGFEWDNDSTNNNPANGWLTDGPSNLVITYNWDGKMLTSTRSTSWVRTKYDPMGNRVWRQGCDGTTTTNRKYIVDINSNLPTILCELDNADDSLKNSYIYAYAQILVQYTHNDDEDETINERFYYVHDRLGSVRLMVDYDDSTDVVGAVNTYTYNPFGDHYTPDISGTTYNPWQFTGQYHDEEINQYYLRARQYDPAMMRFTTRDPVRGEQIQPLSLHKYLYCWNEPLNHSDPSGKLPKMPTAVKRVLGGVTAGFSAYDQMLNTGAYAIESGNWDFFDIAFNIGKLMPYIVGLNTATGGVPIYYKLFPHITVTIVGEHMSGYDLTFYDNIMLGTSRLLFHMSVLDTRNKVGITDEEMADFSDWYNPD